MPLHLYDIDQVRTMSTESILKDFFLEMLTLATSLRCNDTAQALDVIENVHTVLQERADG